MSSKVLSFKVDERLKSDFDKLSKDLGMPVSAMFTVFMKKALSENGLPFEVKRKRSREEVALNISRLVDEKLPPAKYINPNNPDDVKEFFDD